LFLRSFISTTLILVFNTILGYGQVQLEPACFHSIEKYGVSGLPGSDFIWTIVGGTIISGDGTDTVAVRWDEPSKDTIGRLAVNEYTISGCFTTVPSEAIIKIRGPHVELGYYQQEKCFGDTAIFDVGSNFTAPYLIEWQDNSHNQNYFAFSSNKIKVTVTDSAGCIDSDSVNFIINSLPVINLGHDTILCNYDNPLMIYYSQIMANSSTFNSAKWYFAGDSSNDDYISIDPVEFLDTLRVKITDNNNCSQLDTMLILPCDVSILFNNIPNTIMPNVVAGKNTKWEIKFTEIFPNAVLEIFDRWGRLVFHTEHVAEEPWDGTSNGRPLPMDSYYYVLNLNYGNIKPFVGTVNLIK
jgi:gliding motility-associated-like protein